MSDDSIVINFSDRAAKLAFIRQAGTLSGLWEVRMRPRKRTRSLEQNSYYFVAVVQPFRDWLRDEYGDQLISSEQAHEMLKVKILGLDEKLIEGTNEVLKLIPRSKTLTTAEFSSYIDKCAEWLQTFCDITVIPSDMFGGEIK